MESGTVPETQWNIRFLHAVLSVAYISNHIEKILRMMKFSEEIPLVEGTKRDCV